MAVATKADTPADTVARLEAVPAEARSKDQERALAKARNAITQENRALAGLRARARVASDGPGGALAYAIDPAAIEDAESRLDAMSPKEKRSAIGSKALAVSLATMESPTSTTRDAMAAAGLSATIAGLKKERRSVPVTYELPAVSMLAVAPTCCEKCGQSLPVVVRPVAVPSATVAPESTGKSGA